MGPRSRKAIATFGTLAYLAGFIVLALGLWALVPGRSAWKLLAFAIIGIGWGVPLFPLFAWAERGHFGKPR